MYFVFVYFTSRAQNHLGTGINQGKHHPDSKYKSTVGWTVEEGYFEYGNFEYENGNFEYENGNFEYENGNFEKQSGELKTKWGTKGKVNLT